MHGGACFAVKTERGIVMFQKKSWLFLCAAFVLLAAAFFLPFERITCLREDALVTNLNGFTLIGDSGVIAVEGDVTAPVKRLADETGAAAARASSAPCARPSYSA